MKNVLAIVIAVITTIPLIAQSESFGVATFIHPQGWQRMETSGTVAFFHANTINGQTSFCQIILYPASSSTGSATKQFKTAWQILVAIPARSSAKPTTKTEKTSEGWTVTTGTADITNQGINYKTMVANICGFGKTMNIQVNTAGGDYDTAIERFFNDLNLDSKAAVTESKLSDTHNVNINSTPVMNNISMDDYEFIAPEKWQLQKNQDHLLLQNMESGCIMRILEPQPSSGDLEADAKAVFDMMFGGWQYQKTGEQQYALSMGFLPKGLEYCMMEAPMSVTGADGRYHLEEGAALVVKSGDQIVIISVRHHSNMLAHGDCERKYDTWRRFFNSFTVRHVPVPMNHENDVSTRIIGAWSQTESGASSEYIFAANGNYAFTGALGTSYTSSDYNYEYVHIKTYAFDGDGSYAVSGNQLTLNKRSDNSSEQASLRIEKVNHGGLGWKDRLYLLTNDRFGANEVCYEKENR